MPKAKRGPKQHGARPKPRVAARPEKSGGLPLWLPGVLVLGLVAAVVAIFVLNRPSPPPPPPKHVDLVAQLAALKASDLDAVAKGTATTSRFTHVSESPLTSGGQPELLYIGAEYCPYCAGERWALIVALSRFGSFAHVQAITSSEANLPTFSFHGASYTSSYLVFRPVEAADGKGNPLDKPTTAETALEAKYATGIPFVDFGNRFAFDGATFDVSSLQGEDWTQVISQLKTPGSAQAQGILGSANVITAGICRLTGDQPAAVCSDPVIQALAKQLPGA